MKKILFVCTGNICRSTTAQAIARHKVKSLGLENKFTFDSAGTDGFHAGQEPDSRSVATGKERGISFDGIKSRKITLADFENFDFLMCMDRSHHAKLIRIAPKQHQEKIKLFLEFCEAENFWNNEVVDPYYKTHGTFEEVFDVIDMAVENLIERRISPI
jgi:protein-tyrosine phosphatase